MLCRVLPVALILYAVGVQAALAAGCQLGAVAVLPMQLVGSHFQFPVTLNDHDASLILDTGSFATVLDRQAADRLSIRLNATGSDAYGIGGVRHIYLGTPAKFRIGGLKADGMTLAGQDLWRPGFAPDAAGLFGMNMMSTYDIDIDTPGHRLVLYEADGDCGKPNVTLSPPLYAAKLIPIHRDRQADVEVIIDGHPMRAMIDSGANTALYRNAAERLGVDMSGLKAEGHATASGIGEFKVATMRHVFSAVDIGGLRVVNMPITILAQRNSGIDRKHIGSLLSGDDPEEPGGEDMLLGADFMQKVHIWISHSAHMLVMQFPPKPSPPIGGAAK